MAETTIALGGQSYTVRRMPSARALAWRKRATPIVEALPEIVAEYEQESDDLIKAAGRLLTVADGVLEQMIEVVIDADVQMQEDRLHILDHAYDEEYLEAFQSLLLLNTPLAGAAASITAPSGALSGTM